MTNASPGSAHRSARETFVEHVEAFNQHDTERMLAGFTDDASWVTGTSAFRGKSELAGLFDEALWALTPSLTISNLVTDNDRVAAELREQLLIEGQVHVFHVAVFLSVSDGLIRAAKVYREGSADLP